MIPLLIPDLPTAEQLLPWLQQIDQNKWYSNFGPLVILLEQKLTELLNTKHPIFLTTVSTGTAALELALAGLNLPTNSRILTQALTFPATATAIKQVGFHPVFTDVDPHTWALTPEIAYQILEKQQIEAVIPVASFGCPQPVEPWDDFYETTNIPVIIDAAAAFGAQKIGKHCLITFSFHATKPLSCGEGGLVVAPNEDIIQTIRRLSNFGYAHNMQVAHSGTNAKLSEYHAAVGLAQLENWQQIKQQRQQILQYYRHYLKLLGDHVSLQAAPKDGYIPAVFPIKFNHIAELSTLVEHLTQHQIQTRRWYCPPVPNHPAFTNSLVVSPYEEVPYLLVTEALANSLLGLPFHVFLAEEQIKFICEVLLKHISDVH